MLDRVAGMENLYIERILERILCFCLVIPFCESAGLAGYLGIRWNYLVIIVGTVLLISLFWQRKGYKPCIVIGLFYFTILLSTIINSGDVFIAVCYAAKLICFVILINNYAQKNKLELLFSTFKTVLGTFILITLFIQIVNQDFFGFTPSRNHINFLTADNDLGYWYLPFTLIVYLSDAKKGRKYQILDLVFWLSICFTSLVYAWAATCLAIYTLFALLLIFHRMKVFKLLTPFRVLIANIVISALVIFFQIQNSFGWLIEGVLHKDLTLSGRTLIWASALQNILKKPIIGYGTTRGGRMSINHISRRVTFFAHNIFLEITIQGGIVGLFFYIAMHFFASRELRKYPRTDMTIVINLALFCLLLMQFSEFALYEPFANLPLILCFFYKPLVEGGFDRDQTNISK